MALSSSVISFPGLLCRGLSNSFSQQIKAKINTTSIRCWKPLFKKSQYSATLKMGSFVSCNSKNYNVAGSEQEISGRECSTMAGNLDMVEAIVCNEEDIPDGGMKSFILEGTENGKVLLVKSQGELAAIGTKCTHYGAPLEKGVVCNGKVVCPFHGACFSLKTGDIEEFPGLDSIPKYEVEILNGKVKVRASRKLLEANRRVKEMSKRDDNNQDCFVIIGGGAAGAKCVETLRQEGFTGRLMLLTAENCLPYDRPKLSKVMHLPPDSLSLRKDVFYKEADIEVCLQSTVSSVDGSQISVRLSDGKTLKCNKLFIATGSIPRKLNIPGMDLNGVHVLRTPEDANSIFEAAKEKRLIIIGTSFIGMEAAAYFASENRAASVTVIGSSSVPFERSLGREIGQRIQSWFEEKKINFVNKASVAEIAGEDGHVTKVILNDGNTIEGDIILAGVGTTPATEFLNDSGVELDSRGNVPVNENLETNVPGIFCGGDIASFPLFIADNEHVTIGHWQIAHHHGHVAALNMMGKAISVHTVPFFWTVLFGKSVRYAGYGAFDEVIISGNLEELSFIAYYCKQDRVVAVSSLAKDPAVARFAAYLKSNKTLTKDEVLKDGDIALKLQS